MLNSPIPLPRGPLRYLCLGCCTWPFTSLLGWIFAGIPLAHHLRQHGPPAASRGTCVVVLRRRREWEGTHRLFWDAFAAGMAMWCVGEIGFISRPVDRHPRGSSGTRCSACAAASGRWWRSWRCRIAGPRKTTRPGPSRRPRQLRDADRVRLRLLHHGAQRRAGPGPVAAGHAADAGPGPADAAGRRPRRQPVDRRAERSWRADVRASRDRRRRRLLPAAGDQRRHQQRRLTTRAASTTSRGSCRSSATCGRSSKRRRPPATPRRFRSSSGGWPAAVFSVAPVFLIPLIGFGLLRVQPIGDPGDSVRLLLTILAMVAGLGVLTLRLSVQSGELQRADARFRLLAAATEQTARPDPDHARQRRLRARERRLRPRARLLARRARRDDAAGSSSSAASSGWWITSARGPPEGHLARHARPSPQGRQHLSGLEHRRRAEEPRRARDPLRRRRARHHGRV